MVALARIWFFPMKQACFALRNVEASEIVKWLSRDYLCYELFLQVVSSF